MSHRNILGHTGDCSGVGKSGLLKETVSAPAPYNQTRRVVYTGQGKLQKPGVIVTDAQSHQRCIWEEGWILMHFPITHINETNFCICNCCILSVYEVEIIVWLFLIITVKKKKKVTRWYEQCDPRLRLWGSVRCLETVVTDTINKARLNWRTCSVKNLVHSFLTVEIFVNSHKHQV